MKPKLKFIMQKTPNQKSIETKTIIMKTATTHKGKVIDLQNMVSNHASRRMSQRAITDEMIDLTLTYGKVFFKQGLEFYIARKKDLPGNIDPDIRQQMENLVVVLSSRNAEIITCYRSSKGVKHLKRKSNILFNRNRIA